jgi:hypothetical protein
MRPDPALVMHIVHRFDTGGLENGVVNLINHMPRSAYRHMVVALTEVTDFRLRLQHQDVECIALHKRPGHGAKLYPRLWRLLRQHRPAVAHTRNLAALEMQPAAWAARVPVRIHGEHGRDVDGTSRHYQRVRRLYSPFVQRHVALSSDLAGTGNLQGAVGIAPGRIEQIYNGVDAERFAPATMGAALSLVSGLKFKDLNSKDLTPNAWKKDGEWRCLHRGEGGVRRGGAEGGGVSGVAVVGSRHCATGRAVPVP